MTVEEHKKEIMDEINYEIATPSKLDVFMNRLESRCSGNYDTIKEINGKMHYYDHERHQRYDEEIGPELSTDELNKLQAVKEILKAYSDGKIKMSQPRWMLNK